MDQQALKFWIELIAALTMPISMIAILIQRTIGKMRGVGARAIQYQCVVMLMPLLLILAMEKVVDGNVVGTLLGGLLGYILSGLAEFDKNRNAGTVSGDN